MNGRPLTNKINRGTLLRGMMVFKLFEIKLASVDKLQRPNLAPEMNCASFINSGLAESQ